MKVLIFCSLILSMLLVGCMDTYTINNYKSKKDFYNHINLQALGNYTTVNLISGSRIKAEKLHIKNDTTTIYIKKWEYEPDKKTSYPKDKIKSIKYIGFAANSGGNTALIIFKNNTEVLVRGLEQGKDSVYITSTLPQKFLISQKLTFPNKEIKSISYNNIFLGMAEDAGVCTFAGFLIALQASSHVVQPVMGEGTDLFQLDALGLFAGALSGTLLGAVIGSEQQFVLNNYTKQKGLTSFGITCGVNTSNIKSSNIGFSNSIMHYSYGLFATWSFDQNFSVRAELFHITNGGEFSNTVSSKNINYYFNRTAYLNFIELPILFQYTIVQRNFHPRFYIGPSFGIFLNGRVDEQENSTYTFNETKSTKDISPSEVSTPDIGILFGAGVNFLRNITFDLQYNSDFGGYSNSIFNGTAKNLKLHSITFKFGYEF